MGFDFPLLKKTLSNSHCYHSYEEKTKAFRVFLQCIAVIDKALFDLGPIEVLALPAHLENLKNPLFGLSEVTHQFDPAATFLISMLQSQVALKEFTFYQGLFFQSRIEMWKKHFFNEQRVEIDFKAILVWALKQDTQNWSPLERANYAYKLIERYYKVLDPYARLTIVKPAASEHINSSVDIKEIGVLGSKHPKGLLVFRVLPKSPARYAGLKAGDIITYGGENPKSPVSFKGFKVNEVNRILKGKEEKDLFIQFERKGLKFPKRIKVKRKGVLKENVYLQEIYKEQNAMQIAHVVINSFMADTKSMCTKLFNIFKYLEKDKKVEGLLLDVRYNEGGYVQNAVCLLKMLVPGQSALVKFIKKTRDGTGKMYETVEKEITAQSSTTFPFIISVLTNGHSSSAAEFIAGALSTHNRGFSVGEKTFGKGLRQAPKLTSNLSQLQFPFPLKHSEWVRLHRTDAQFFFYGGHNVWSNHLVGVTPDFPVAFDSSQPEEPILRNTSLYNESYEPNSNVVPRELSKKDLQIRNEIKSCLKNLNRAASRMRSPNFAHDMQVLLARDVILCLGCMGSQGLKMSCLPKNH